MKHKLTNLFIAALMTACSSVPVKTFPDITKMVPSKSEEPTIAANVITPEWTALASGVYREPSGKEVFYGLGSVGKEESTSDRKILSEDRARNELAKVFNSYIRRLAKEVAGLNLSHSLTDVHRDQLDRSLDERTATILMEAEITKYWTNENTGKVYSMAKLDLNRLTDKLDSIESISTADRSFLKESIFRTHSSMANEQTSQVQFIKEEIIPPTKLERQLSY